MRVCSLFIPGSASLAMFVKGAALFQEQMSFILKKTHVVTVVSAL